MRKQNITINIIEGNLVNVEAPSIILGIYKSHTLPAAAASFNKLIDEDFEQLLKGGQIKTGLGEITHLHVTSTELQTTHLVIVGLGYFDILSEGILTTVGEAIATDAVDRNADTITTVPLGLGVGVSHEVAVPALLRGITNIIRGKSSVKKINICDLNESRCIDTREECRKFLEGQEDFAVTFTNDKVSIEGPEGDLPSQPLQLMIKTNDDGNQITFDLHFIGVHSNAFQREHKIDRSEYHQYLSDQLNQFETTHIYFGHDRGIEIFKFFVGEEMFNIINDEIGFFVRPIKIIHDRGAFDIPWEAMSLTARRLPATNLPLSRSFILDNNAYKSAGNKKTLTTRRKLKKLNLLLVVDPSRFDPGVKPLYGAENEGQAVFSAVSDKALKDLVDITPFFPDENNKVTKDLLIDELQSGKYDVFHFAGHANFNQNDPSQSGLLCAGGEYLTADEVKEHISTFPPLMFLNACRSIRIDGVADDNTEEQFRRGCGVAEAFLSSGVEQMIGTYWKVADKAAETFSRELYKQLLAGLTIGEAIFRARQAVWQDKEHKNKKNWVNYIHFGEPSFRVKLAPRD